MQEVNSKKLLVVTGGGDCPGLNAVIRAIVKRASVEAQWKVWGSVEAFKGVMSESPQLKELNLKAVAGIHVLGGSILKTSSKGNPLKWPVQRHDGSWTIEDKSKDLVERIKSLGFDAVISIGGDGSQRIAYELQKFGCNVVGVPKTIDNDLAGTDITFGYSTAVETATEAIGRLVTTAESHNRVMIIEVMGRDAGWIALASAVAGGAEVCLIPEIPYDIRKVLKRVEQRFVDGKGFAIIVVAEGARPVGGEVVAQKEVSSGVESLRRGGVAYVLAQQFKDAGLTAEVRETVLGHLQRGGSPIAYDRILATQFGVKAFELVKEGLFGTMVSVKSGQISYSNLEEAATKYRTVELSGDLMKAARGVGVCFGD
jgi:ATP-dependent phosphofructokinase / diphosphate-dependent phosphofructokinase